MDLMKALTNTLDESNITYFIAAGTLLGSWRHHDIIPWDDDMDIYVAEKERHAITMALEKLQPDYMLVYHGKRFKFHSKRSREIGIQRQHWPFVDVNLYFENATHIWDVDLGFAHFYPKNQVFPTHKRPLGELKLNAPRDSFAMLREFYGPTDQCKSKYYSHKTESWIGGKSVTVPCQIFKSIFPFVHRSPAEFGIKETLKLDGVIIQSITVNEPVYALTKPYALILMNNTK